MTVEDVLLAMCEVFGGGKNIKSASRMNKAIVVFLAETAMVDKLIEEGLVIMDSFVQVLPLSSPAKRVVLSNVPPYFENEILEGILSRYGKQTAPIRPVLVGFKNPTLVHVESFRKQTFMILNEQHRDLDVAVKLVQGGKDYIIYISSNTMKCFTCGEHGHFSRSCPNTAHGERIPGPATKPPGPVAELRAPAPTPPGHVADLRPPGPAPTPPGPVAVSHTPGPGSTPSGPVVDSQTPGPSSAGAQRPFRWQEKQFAPTPPPTSTADEDPEISASLEADDEEDAHRNLQQPKSASQPQRSSGKRKARSNASQAGAKTGRRTRSLERSVAGSGDESEIDFNEYQEVTMENVQQPVEGESVDALGKFAKKGKQNLYSITRLNKFLDDTKGQRKVSLTSFFPDYNLFLLSSTAALRNATMTELTIQKRFRIKKLQSIVRAELSSRVKSTVLPNE